MVEKQYILPDISPKGRSDSKNLTCLPIDDYGQRYNMKPKWFTTFNKKPDANTVLFCFPFAGGTASIFSSWHESLSDDVEVFALQAPGKASRLSETPINNMEEFATQIAANITPLIDRDYVFFGHSLGARVAFEVSLKLVEKGLPPPKHFIASASSAPSIKRKKAPLYGLPEAQLIDKLRELGGTPDLVLDNEQLRSIYFPAIRADFQILDKYQGNISKLEASAHIFYGLQDHTIEIEDIIYWKEHFTQPCELYSLEGGHFFIDSEKEKVLYLINQILQSSYLLKR